MSRKFRGRILSSEFEGYDPRHQLELSLRAGIGSVLLLALSRRVKDQADGTWPDDAHLDVVNTQVHRRAIALIQAAHSGDVTKQTFTMLYPDADDRPEAVDLVWFHVERAVEQVKSVRACVRATLDDLIDRYDLMNPASAKTFISPGPVMETWMSDSIVPADVKAKFVREVSVLEDVPDEQKDWHPGSNNQVLDLVHPSLYCCVYGIYYFGCDNISDSKLSFRVIVQPPEYEHDDRIGIASVYGLEDESALVQSLGTLTAVEDRCIVFPNTFQHKVEAFELADQGKPAAKKHREELMKERGPFNPKACRDLVFSLCEH
ncbi:hypothetical protein P43SY_000671 [Pythium insidiosum]|uniref:DUF4246 domain-containing protein n=1 Tax=Pythium insidiosum TaxID=114742 RepID=A0AAD5L9F2_PYTIN|nr:hypothetical protein P43SY_000671 [Pythium insidiosum]